MPKIDRNRGRYLSYIILNMEKGEFEESKTFNLADILEFNSNAIVVKNISVQNNCIIQAFAFDFGKVLSHNESPFIRFIHIIEGKAEVVINGNSTFMRSGDSIIIPAFTPCSFEANHKFKMLCTTIKNE
jgi:quercetin dioxygenase-like cupin family protein